MKDETKLVLMLASLALFMFAAGFFLGMLTESIGGLSCAG